MTVKRVEVLAYAKINLMLDIIRRRTDGYHDLFMIMQSVGVADRVTVEREPGRKLRLTASMDDIPLDDKNIAWKAAALFFKTTGLRRPGLHIHLEKHIPHAAGLAGGSADGAAVLVALNRLMGTDLSTDSCAPWACRSVQMCLLHCRRHLPCTGDWRGAQSLKAYAVLSYCTGKAGLWCEYRQGLRLV